MLNNTKILVGKIVAPQGIRGDVRVQTYTASPMDLKTLTVECDAFATGDFKFIRRLNPKSDVIVAHIRGFDDRNAAEKLRGVQIFVDRSSLPDVDDGEYYQADLIGFTIIRGDKNIGTLAGFQNFGAGDIIETDGGDMISFAGADVDMENKVIRVK